jgi:ADP-ribose pyrophosphatase YjhB (NUDIX family)
VILAAGGALWRADENSGVDVLLIRTPRGVWTLPKGKQRRTEAALSCALREVREETGFVCVANHELLTVTYQDRKDRTKQVRFWAMEPQSGAFRRNAEVEAIAWLPLSSAASRLTHERDAQVLGALSQYLGEFASERALIVA